MAEFSGPTGVVTAYGVLAQIYDQDSRYTRIVNTDDNAQPVAEAKVRPTRKETK